MRRVIAVVVCVWAVCVWGCTDNTEQGETACVINVKKCVDGIVFRCDGGSWKETKQSCNLNGKVCIGGMRKCNGDKLMTCSKGSWAVAENCEETSKLCDEESLMCIGCSGDEVACDGEVLKQCRDGVWESTETCSGDTPFCNPDAARCQACKEGKVGCASKKLRKCEDGEWHILKTCDEGECDVETMSCRVCTEKEKRCNDGVLQTCQAGVWKDTKDCSAAQLHCDDVRYECRDLTCEPGAMKCEKYGDDAFFYTCSEAGVWQKHTKCRFGNCAKGKPQCAEAKCEIGERKCQKNDTENDVLLECDGYDFAPKEECEIMCRDGSSKKPYCAECKFHTSTCMNGAVYWCNSEDIWEKVKDCASGACEDATKCSEDECRYLDEQCRMSGSNARKYNCVHEDGEIHWKGGIYCGQECHSDGIQCLVCHEGETKCWEDRVAKCIDNDWHEVEKCTATGVCRNGKCLLCYEDDVKCNIWSGSYSICTNNKWISKGKCESGYCYDEYACLEADCGRQGRTHCINNTELQCSSDSTWKVKRKCSCLEGVCLD